MKQGCLIQKTKIFLSFSGGRTSAYMVEMMLLLYSDQYEFVVTFANTGQEHDATLEFIRQCDQRWGGIVVWLEAVVNPEKNKGTRHTVVCYETATRWHETHENTPFSQVIAKYGIPGMMAPQICTRELKGAVMRSHKRDIEKQDKAKYFTAIGIRTDEASRLMGEADKSKFRVVYPLMDWFPTDKGDVLDYWEEQEFDLQIPEHLGNCVTCWKKSDTKLVKIAKEQPEFFGFFEKMEKMHPQTNNKEGYRDRLFFRRHRKVQDLMDMAALIDVVNITDDAADVGGCSESCEAASPEMFDFEDNAD
jgi:3'-phosphoadenosine 5'-phosphosulfate sulfotransferase (PAPS reductase)/FAD synthetase